MDFDLAKVGLPATALIAAVALLLYFWPRPAKALLDKTKKKVRILDIRELSPDTKLFRLDLGKGGTLGLPVGKHMSLFAPNPKSCLASGKWNGKDDADRKQLEISRKYTPITGDDTVGYVDLAIKIYRPGKFRMADGKEVIWDDGGKMGVYLDALRPGDKVEVSGPFGVNEYLGGGTFKTPGKTHSVKEVGMLCGGTGITPMLQVARAALQNPADTTRFTMINANKSADDILVGDVLADLERQSNGRLVVHHTLDFPPAGWKGKTGFVTADMIRELLPPPGPDTLVLICGPPPFVDFACKANLETLGYPKERIATF